MDSHDFGNGFIGDLYGIYKTLEMALWGGFVKICGDLGVFGNGFASIGRGFARICR